jgi:hypothetical protein
MARKYRSLRHPRTTQERRLNYSDEHRRFTRGKRRRLPTVWDDILLPYWRNENWKNLRKTQYRPVKITATDATPQYPDYPPKQARLPRG